MSKKSTALNVAMMTALLLALLGLGGLGYYVYSRIFANPRIVLAPPSPSSTAPIQSEIPPTSIPSSSDPLADIRISSGEKMLIKQEEGDKKNSSFFNLKEQGNKFFSQKNYVEAALSFHDALIKHPNTPETRIYYNNSKIGEKKTYSIAVIVRSNDNPQESLKILRGVAQAQEEINTQGGINNIPLKVIIVNDDNKPEIASAMARVIAKKNDVLGTIGHYSSDCTIAAGKVYDELKLVSISPTSTSDKITNLSPYVFRTIPNDSAAGKTLADYTIQNNWRTAVILYDSEKAYSQSLKSAFAQSLIANQGSIVAEIDISQPGNNYRDRLQQLKDKSQVLMLALPDTRLDEVPLIGLANQGKMHLLGGDDLYNIKVLNKKETESLVGMVLAVPWTIGNNRNTPFVQKSKELWKADVDWQTAMTYDATQALIYAIKASPEPTRETVKNALSSPEFSATGASQTIKFSRGDRDSNDRLVRIDKQAKSRSGTGYDFVGID